ncbi:MAG: metallophosphoesterase [Bdellovibrionales bacterium]|nr:metallophosphoesterase [Bdellovibrionales bacterium]
MKISKVFKKVAGGVGVLALIISLVVLQQGSTRSPQSKNPKHLDVFSKSLLGQKICVLGDTGSDTPEQYRVAAALEKQGCDQIRILGDLIYDDGLKSADDPLYQAAFVKPYESLIQASQGPKFFMTLGNHDYQGNPGAWVELAKRHHYLYIPHRYYAESYGPDEVCIATLDTSPYDSLKWFFKGFGQGAWVRDITDSFRNCAMTIALGHHPYWNSGHHGDARAFLKGFLNRNIVGRFDIYMAGHEHFISDEGEAQGTHLVVSGAGGKEPTESFREPKGGFVRSSLGFVVMTLSKNADQKIQAKLDYVTEEAGTFAVHHSRTIVGKGIR